MSKHPAEIFGYPIEVSTSESKEIRAKHRCPFMDKVCEKKSRLITYPMGVCSVKYKDDIIAICPRRFLQDQMVIGDIADQYFGDRNDLLLFPEVGLRGLGSFDFVLVRHKPMSSDIEDFVLIEFQTDQTTSTGELVEGLRHFVAGQDIVGRTYKFGMNTYDTLKRSYTQILNKGVVVESWGQRIYWVFQEYVYRNLSQRYNLDLTYDQSKAIVFTLYDLKSQTGRLTLAHSRSLSATIDELFYALRHNPNIPKKDALVKALKRRIAKQMPALQLHF
jgi:hypothetical protein